MVAKYSDTLADPRVDESNVTTVEAVTDCHLAHLA